MTKRMEIDIAEVPRFFDERPPRSRGHATAIASVLGEDLGVGLLAHCFEQQGASIDVLPGPCTQRKVSGKRLDKWVQVTRDGTTTYCQVEIKN